MKSLKTPLFLVGFLLFPSCGDVPPLAPSTTMTVKVRVPLTGEFRPSLLGSTSDRILYVVRDNSGVRMSGSVGPFANAVSFGSYDLTLDNVPVGPGAVLSVQLNDASTGPETPLAVGAMGLDVSSLAAGPLLLEMGSIQRNCYNTNYFSYQWGYNFTTDSMGATTTGDMACYVAPGVNVPATLMDPNFVTPANSIAFMGNGDLVDFAYVPPVTAFNTTSFLAKGGTGLQIGDVYCVKLVSSPGAHAWIQITNIGNGQSYQGAFFNFRMNSILPYYAYERTAPDIASACASIW